MKTLSISVVRLPLHVVVLVAALASACSSRPTFEDTPYAPPTSPSSSSPSSPGTLRAGGECDAEGSLVCGADERTILFCGTPNAADGGHDGAADGAPSPPQTGAKARYTAVAACPGRQTCRPIEGASSVNCGLPDGEFIVAYAIEGETCAAEQAAACNFEQTVVLQCQRGRWKAAETCGEGTTRCDFVARGQRFGSDRQCTGSNGCIACL